MRKKKVGEAGPSASAGAGPPAAAARSSSSTVATSSTPRRRAGGKRLALQVQLSAAQDLFLEACAAVKVAEKKMDNLDAIQAEWLRKNGKWFDKNDVANVPAAGTTEDKLFRYLSLIHISEPTRPY